jgi:hypothetical protein
VEFLQTRGRRRRRRRNKIKYVNKTAGAVTKEEWQEDEKEQVTKYEETG